MSVLHYRLLNVFTRGSERLSGNPLCVFEDGEGLDSETMQGLARQFNLSETTFLLPATVRGAHARVRIFTPNYELPFAGHPTLGTASVCRSLGLAGNSLKLEMTAGIIPVSAEEQRWTLTAQLRHTRVVTWSRAQLAEVLGLESGEVGDGPLWVSTGREQLLIPLTDVAAVERAQPRRELFEGLLSEEGAAMAYVFAQSGEAVVARFFFPQRGAVLEDPATGSAAANLGGWWLATARALPCRLEIAQGERVARPSLLYLEVSADRAIAVGGNVIELGRGSLML